MLTTDKDSCLTLVDVAFSHGVRHAVVSPGSRNAPLLVALARDNRIARHVVIDERSAAFIALGIASQTTQPVMLVCTSGTALLNYAPAIAEAYYRQLPLIVVSADRPAEWIDQDDSQTIRQPGALANFVKRTYALKAECADDTQRWWINRELNDAMLTALDGRRGPVHINISIDEPLNTMADNASRQQPRVIKVVAPRQELSLSETRWIAAELASPRKLLIIGGFHEPDERLNKALASIARLPNAAVMAENIANLRFTELIDNIDSTLSVIPDGEIEALRPDVVLSFGGALVSRLVKRFLRESPATEHWYVGHVDHTVDCFQSLTRRVEMDPSMFFSQLAAALRPHRAYCNYAAWWRSARDAARQSHERYIATLPWCDLKMFHQLFNAIPRGWHLQLSNGTAIRYAQLFNNDRIARRDCNRGVSGIDGSTSTAIGASLCHDGVTLLVTGDMSAQYDIGALASPLISPRLKILVVCNGGGGIFRFIQSTSRLPELNDYFACGTRLPLRQLCDGFSMAYFQASDSKEFDQQFRLFAAEKRQPALMAVYTDGMLSAETLRGYFNRNKSTLKP